MHAHALLASAFALLLTLATASETLASPTPSSQSADLHALDGEWIYVEDLTEGRALESLGPPMSSKFSLLAEDDAVVLVSGHGSGHTNVRVALDGSTTEVAGASEGTFAIYRGAWDDGTFTYQTEFVRAPGHAPEGLIRKEMTLTDDGLRVRVTVGSPPILDSVALYRHVQDIALPTPAAASIGDLAWLSGAWVGTRGTSGTTSIEERWGPPLGGALLGTSRTVSRGTMTAFEYLRVVERDGGLVYVAQPNGGSPTEFVLTELSATRAVFENPRHDYPKRIVYELTADGGLDASIGFSRGGSPRHFLYTREGG